VCFKNVCTHKKKLSTDTGIKKDEPEQELTYNYLLSLFVVNFNYSITEFDLLTPVQAFQILGMKTEKDANKFDLIKNELRTVSYYILKSSMSDTAHIDTPRDLYPLHIDEQFEEIEKEKFKNVQYDEEFSNFAEQFLKKETEN
jgi:hypothetical protein